MARPHPALVDLVSGRPVTPIKDDRELLRSARQHWMQGLLWKSVTRGTVVVSLPVERILAMEFMRTKARHRQFWEVYEDISQVLGEHGIEFAVLKGVAVEARWYDEMGERPCRDVDIWISPHQVDRAGEVLRILCPNHQLVDHFQDFIDRSYLQGINFKTASGVSIDLHTDVFKVGVPVRSAHEIWARTLSCKPLNRPRIRVLDAETTLIHLLLHLNVDRFARLSRMVDILHVIDRAQIDWTYVEDLASEDGLERPVNMSLQAVCDMFSRESPSVRPADLKASIWRLLWPASSHALGAQAARWRLRQRWIPFLGRGRSWEALSWLTKRAFPPKEVLAYYFPDTSGPYLWQVFSSRLGFQKEWHRRWTRHGAAN